MKKLLLTVSVSSMLVSAANASIMYTNDSIYAAISKPVLIRMEKLYAVGDTQAVLQLAIAGFAVHVDKGVKVHVLERSGLGNRVKIRRYGTHEALWTWNVNLTHGEIRTMVENPSQYVRSQKDETDPFYTVFSIAMTLLVGAFMPMLIVAGILKLRDRKNKKG